MMKLILDVFGGDDVPAANLLGAIQALPELTAELILLGDETSIREHLKKRRYRPLAQALELKKVRIVGASETIDMADSIKAIRSKPNASINIGCRMAAEDWKAGTPTAFISAGHSGAMMASALLNMGRMKGAERPAIAARLPSLSPQGFILLDVGANVDCKPEQLRDFAVMGALYASADWKSPELPKVGILSNGGELSKGNELTRATVELLKDHPIFFGPSRIAQFIGYTEGKEMFKGHVDVVVTDGFTGNVVLKSIEGLGLAVKTLLTRGARSSPLNTFGFLMASGFFHGFKRKMDYAEYGGAPLLGVAGYAFICHGSSNAKAIKNALLRTQTALRSDFGKKLAQALTLAHTPSPSISKSSFEVNS